MATIFTLQDGNLNDRLTYGYSLSGSEINNNTTGIWLSTVDSYSPLFKGNGNDIQAIAINLSAKGNNTDDKTLILKLSSSSNVITETYAISSLTNYNGSNNLVSYLPINWQLLKLTNSFSLASTASARLSLATSAPSTLSIICSSTNYNYNKIVLTQDSSVLTVTATNTNNVKLSTASPFGVGIDGSMYFDGAAPKPRLEIPHDSRLNFNSDYTLEFWYYKLSSAANQGLFYKGNYAFQIYCNTNNKIALYISNIDSNTYQLNNAEFGPILSETWNHISICLQGNTYYGSVNGVVQTLAVIDPFLSPYPLDTPNSTLKIGWISDTLYTYGYMSNIRIINGTALYTSNFTVPTAPLDHKLNTVLLLRAPYSLSSYEATNTYGHHNIHIGSCLKGLSSEPRFITASNSSMNNLYIHKDGTLNFPENSTTLNIYGSAGLQITQEGTLNVGTSSSYVPLSTIHTINLSNTQIDVNNGGNLNIYGCPKTISTYLSSTVNNGSRTFTATDSVSTSWLSGDILVFTPNLTNKTNFDQLTLSSFNSNNIFTTTSNSSYTHLGLSSMPYVPTVYNLSRNIKIQGLNSSFRGTIRTIDAAKTNVNYAQLSNFGILSSAYASVLSSTLGLSSLSSANSKNGFIIANNLSGSTNLSGVSNCGDTADVTSLGLYSTAFTYYFNCSLLPYPHSAGLSLSGSSFTVEFWLNPTIYNPSIVKSAIISKRFSGTGGSPAYEMGLGTGGLYYGNQNTKYHSNYFPKPNRWTHCAWVYNGTSMSIYANGISLTTFNPIITNNLDNLNIGGITNGSFDESLSGGGLYGIRIIKGLALYTSNFSPSLEPPTNYTVTNSFSTVFLCLTSTSYDPLINLSGFNLSGFRDYTTNYVPSAFASGNSRRPAVLSNGIFYGTSNNISIKNNIFYKIPLSFDIINQKLNNVTFSNNYILSSASTGILLQNLSGSADISNNTTIAALSYGALLLNNTLTGTYGSINYNSGLRGMMVSGINTGTIVGGGINSGQEGVYVDASTYNLSSITFQNVIASNNSSVGFKVSGNNLNYLTPITLNINGLTANNNSSNSIEAYNITGNLTSLNLSNNTSGAKISIGNGSTIFDGLTSITSNIPLNVLSAYNYNQTIIRNSLLSSSTNPALTLDSCKLEEFRLDNSTLSGSTPILFSTSRNILEGSYLFNKCNFNHSVLSSVAISGYQPEVFTETGFSVMSENGISNKHYKYLYAGKISFDSTLAYSTNTCSEKLEPYSSKIKLRSSSKRIPVNNGTGLSISVFIYKSTTPAYTGSVPRLIVSSNPSLGYNDDIILSTSSSGNGIWEELTGILPNCISDGVIEVYVDCSGTIGSGSINIDNWNFN